MEAFSDGELMAIKHTIRANGSGKLKEVILTPLSAIRDHCIECFGFQIREVQHCSSPLCALYPFRMYDAHRGKKRVSKNLPKVALQKAVSGLISGVRLRGKGVVAIHKRRLNFSQKTGVDE